MYIHNIYIYIYIYSHTYTPQITSVQFSLEITL